MSEQLPETPLSVAERSDVLAELHAAIFPPRLSPHLRPGVSVGLDDAELLRKMFAASNGPRVLRLYQGDTSEYDGDDSSADLALCNHLAFWTGGDAARMDHIFRNSGLFRPKWDERRGAETYGGITIRRAIESVGDYYATSDISQNGRRPRKKHQGDHDLDGRDKAGPGSSTDAVTRTLGEVVATFEKWLYLEQRDLIYAGLGTVAANYQPGDPTWLMYVSASSSGKTEMINAMSGLPDVHLAATMTEASLLSGTPKRERDGNASGGLLRVVGDFGILLCKDFTSILSMHRDARASLLAALREVYDGSWTRHVGVDGGRSLHWQGKLGLVAGCTAAIDSHHSVMATMGERFLLYRQPDVDPLKQARKALANAGHEQEMRRELSGVVSDFFASLTLPKTLPELEEAESDWLIALAALVARSRSASERDGHTREIELILDPEAPARLVQALSRLYGGLLAIGLDRALAQPVTVKVGMDCLPKLRRHVFDHLMNVEASRDTPAIATAIGYPTQTARRTLEDLAAHGIVERQSIRAGKADCWHLSRWAREMYARATVPEKSEAHEPL